jgi:hypothetical protein
MSREQTRQFVIDLLQRGDEAVIDELVNKIEGGPPPVTPERDRSDFLYAAHRFQAERSDLYDDGLEQQVNALEKHVIAQAPELDYTTRYRVLSQVCDNVLGSAEQRVIRAMQRQRRRGRGEADEEGQRVVPEEPSEFDVEHEGGKAEGMEQLRAGRAGRVLSSEQIAKAREWDETLRRRREAGG